MNILMTGGTGFIGQAFINYHPEHHFTVLTRSAIRTNKKALQNSISYINTLNELETLNEFDAIINLAGEPIADKRWTRRQKERICQSRWRITEDLIYLIEKSETPPKVFLSGSAIGYYGADSSTPFTESSEPYLNDFSHLVCQKWESITQPVQNKTRVAHLRTGVVLGKQGGALKKMLPVFKMGLGGRIGSGHQFMSWIHIEDVIRIIDFLLFCDNATGPFNLTAPEPVDNTTFTETLAQTLKRPAVFPVPAFILKKLMGESAHLLLASQRIIPEKLSTSGFEFKFPGLQQALNDILDNTADAVVV